MTMLGLSGVLFCENEQTLINESSFVREKTLTQVLREAGEGLKATTGREQ